jgi:hypothetical protein
MIVLKESLQIKFNEIKNLQHEIPMFLIYFTPNPLFVFISPPQIKPKQKMHYAATKQQLLNQIQKVLNEKLELKVKKGNDFSLNWIQ